MWNTASPLDNKDQHPDNAVLQHALGTAYAAWQSFEGFLKATDKATLEWRYYNDTKCWLAKVQVKKKTFIWIKAHEGYFRCAFHFASEFKDEILQSSLAETLIERFSQSSTGKKNGTVTVFVKGEADLLPFEELFRLKRLYYFGKV
ncbi:MAG: DUF3788 domain-containing protein [Deferribacteraceae bacterium]|jgi:hypothetical protein|nr:DUF3788 domain-containing protein [Deferribacteraceae bacterium]